MVPVCVLLFGCVNCFLCMIKCVLGLLFLVCVMQSVWLCMCGLFLFTYYIFGCAYLNLFDCRWFVFVCELQCVWVFVFFMCMLQYLLVFVVCICLYGTACLGVCCLPVLYSLLRCVCVVCFCLYSTACLGVCVVSFCVYSVVCLGVCMVCFCLYSTTCLGVCMVCFCLYGTACLGVCVCFFMCTAICSGAHALFLGV